MLVTMDTASLNVTTGKIYTQPQADDVPEVEIIEPDFSHFESRVKHLEFLPADYKTMDVADAPLIVSAGMGAISDDLWPLVNELAGLLEGTIGATRPVIDEGKVARDRMIGQTGKVVSPELYLALGISGASHHIGGYRKRELWSRSTAILRHPFSRVRT